jgi:hypothetical protein
VITIPSQTVDDARLSGNECGIPSGSPSFSNSNVLTVPPGSRGSENETIDDARVPENETINAGRGHFITRFLTTTGPADVPDTGKNLESSSWTSLLTQSMSILGGGYGNKIFSENNDSNLSVCV